MNLLLSLLLVVSAGTLLLNVLIIRYILTNIQSLKSLFSSITATEEGKPSQIAQTAQVFSDMLARSVVVQAKTTFMGKQSGAVRADSAIEGDIAEGIAGYRLKRSYDLTAPKGVRGRNSENTLIKHYLGWEPSISLKDGLTKTYAWIKEQMISDKELQATVPHHAKHKQ